MTPEVEAMIRAAHGKCPPAGCFRRVLLDALDEARALRDEYFDAIVRFNTAQSGTAIVKALDHLRAVVGMPKDPKAAGI